MNKIISTEEYILTQENITLEKAKEFALLINNEPELRHFIPCEKLDDGTWIPIKEPEPVMYDDPDIYHSDLNLYYECMDQVIFSLDGDYQLFDSEGNIMKYPLIMVRKLGVIHNKAEGGWWIDSIKELVDARVLFFNDNGTSKFYNLDNR